VCVVYYAKTKLSEMVRTRATTSGANNPLHETGGGSHQNATEMEARLAQMARDMEVLTQQNLRLLRRLADERIPEVAEGNEEEESNTHNEADRESRRITERTQQEDQSRPTEGIANPPPGDGLMNHQYEERRLN
jgi:hypothetical protein